MKYIHANTSLQNHSVRIFLSTLTLYFSRFTQLGTSRCRFPRVKQRLLCLRSLAKRSVVLMRNVFDNKFAWMKHWHVFIYSVNTAVVTGVHLATVSHMWVNDILLCSVPLAYTSTFLRRGSPETLQYRVNVVNATKVWVNQGQMEEGS